MPTCSENCSRRANGNSQISRGDAPRISKNIRNSVRPMASKMSAEAFGTTTSSSLRKASLRTIGAFSTMVVVDRTTPSLIPSHGSSPEIRKKM